MVTVMTIAGADPSCGAGIAADIKTLCALDVYPTSVITCITAQNDSRFYTKVPLQPSLVTEQIKAVADYYKIGAVKIGMLGSKENVMAVAKAIKLHGLKNIVLDPLIKSTSGADLIDSEAIPFLKNELFPLTDMLTPNVAEAEKLADMKVSHIQDLRDAALKIAAFGCKSVIIKGYIEDSQYIDLLYDGGQFVEYKKELLKLPDLHGTGCTFSAAAAAFRAKGCSIKEAVAHAKEFTYYSIKYANKLCDDKLVLNQFFMKGSY